MLLHSRRRCQHARRGTSVVELAVILPFLLALFALAVDYARIFYFAVTLENCARNGAYYASNYPNANHIYNDIYGYKNLDDAILRDAGNLYSDATPENKPTYTVRYDTSPDGAFTQTTPPVSNGYVRVNVNWTFHAVTGYPPMPATTELSRAVTMQIAPALPQFP